MGRTVGKSQFTAISYRHQGGRAPRALVGLAIFALSCSALAACTNQASTGGGSARGVTSNEITIGVVYPRTDNLVASDPNNYGGDGVKIQNAVLQQWRAEHKDVINGRKIRFVYYQVNFLDPSDQRRACTDLVEDEKVFAVIGAGLGTGRSCIAQEFHTPIISDDWGQLTTDAYLKQNAPYLFSTPMSTTALMKYWVDWANQGGYLTGKRIGFYYVREDGPDPDGLANAFEAEAQKVGANIVAKMGTSSEANPADDATAVQKFKQAGVNLAMLVLGPREITFLQDAAQQNYHPTYLGNDYVLTTRDMHANHFPAAEFQGTYAMTDAHMGEWGSPPLSPQTKACVDNYTKYSGEKIAGPQVEYEDILITCDLSTVLRIGLEGAGRDLTTASFIHALETDVKHVKGALYGDISFSPTQHWGADAVRTIQWDANCKTATTTSCWKVVGNGSFKIVTPS